MVSSVSQTKQSVKITQGIEVYRDFYPTNKELVTLECTWEIDKFLLTEKTHKRSIMGEDGGDASIHTLAVQYKSIEAFLGDDDSEINTAKEGPSHNQEDTKDLLASPSSKIENKTQSDGGSEVRDNPVTVETKDEKLHSEGEPPANSTVSPTSKMLPEKSGGKSTAFVGVKRPAPSTSAFVAVKRPAISTVDPDSEESVKDSSNKEDSFFDLLTGGTIK